MIQAFPRNAVRLLDGPIKDRQSLTGRYLLELETDRLLHNFQRNAGLDSTAEPLGGWESPTCGLRGHFVGHYLSACAQMFATTGNERFKQRAETIVDEFARCQIALGGQYLSAFSMSDFDTLEEQFGGVWAPYYTLHKILAGLLDAHRDADSAAAIEIASRIGDWITQRMAQLRSSKLEPLLRTDQLNPANEYGGIGESLYDLYQITQQPKYLTTAKLFDRDWFLVPLIEQKDALAGLHANTHIPQALAAARRFEITGDERYRQAVEYFWERTALQRSYVNGGSSGPRPDRKEHSEGGEHWPQAGRLAGTLAPKINESCVVHNMLRLTDTLTRWSQNPRYAEFRERAWLNDVLCMQHPGQVGGYIYSLPLAGSSRKVFGDSVNTFWCCYGTTVEAYARLAEGIYFHDETTLWVNQFVASEVRWLGKQVRIIQQSGFPYEARTRLTIRSERPIEFTMKLRVPSWAHNALCTVNGGPVAQSNGYATIPRFWRDGDSVELTLPMTLRAETLPDDPNTFAYLYGPTVLAARTPHPPVIGVTADEALQSVRAIDTSRLIFSMKLAFGMEVPLVPMHEIVDEPFGVYVKTPLVRESQSGK